MSKTRYPVRHKLIIPVNLSQQVVEYHKVRGDLLVVLLSPFSKFGNVFLQLVNVKVLVDILVRQIIVVVVELCADKGDTELEVFVFGVIIKHTLY